LFTVNPRGCNVDAAAIKMAVLMIKTPIVLRTASWRCCRICSTPQPASRTLILRIIKAIDETVVPIIPAISRYVLLSLPGTSAGIDGTSPFITSPIGGKAKKRLAMNATTMMITIELNTCFTLPVEPNIKNRQMRRDNPIAHIAAGIPPGVQLFDHSNNTSLMIPINPTTAGRIMIQTKVIISVAIGRPIC